MSELEVVKDMAEAVVYNQMSESPKEDLDQIIEWMVDYYELGKSEGLKNVSNND